MADVSLDELRREQEALREQLGSLEQELERKIRLQLEAQFNQKLQAELSATDSDVTFLKTKVKVLEAENAQRAAAVPAPAQPSSAVPSKPTAAPGTAGFPALTKAEVANYAKTKLVEIKEFGRNFSFAKYIKIIALVQLALIFLANVERYDPYGVIIIIALYAVHEQDKQATLAYIVLTALSIILDLVWLGEHSKSRAFAVTKAFGSTHSFVWAVTFISFIFKALVLWPAFLTFREMPLVKPSEQGLPGSQGPPSVVFRVVQAGAAAQILFSFINSLARADLYGLVLLLLIYAIHEKDKGVFLIFYALLGVSALVDIIWLGIHGSGKIILPDQLEAAESTPYKAVFVTTIILLILKVLLAIPTVPVFRSLPSKKPSESRYGASSAGGPEPASFVGKLAGRVTEFAQQLQFDKAVSYILIAQFVLCLFEQLARYDVYAIVIVIGLYAVNEKDKLALEGYLVLSFVSFIFDIVWLDLHKQQGKFAWQAGTAAAVGFVFAAIIIKMLIQVAMLFPVLKLHQELPDIKPEDQETAIGKQRAKLLAYYAKFQDLAEVEKYRRVLLLFGIIQLVLFFLTALDRFDPFCVVIPILFYAVHERDRTALTSYLVFMDFSIVLDIVWLSAHSDDLSALLDAAVSGRVTGVKTSLEFVYAMTVLGIFVKIAAHIPAILLLQVLPLVKPSDEGSSIAYQEELASGGVPLTTYSTSGYDRSLGPLDDPGVRSAPVYQSEDSGRVPSYPPVRGAQASPPHYDDESRYYGESSSAGPSSMSDLERAIKEREQRLTASGY